MPSSLRLRALDASDLSFADGVRSLAGWNQTLEDWRRFLALSPKGCFLAEWNGARAGTATTLTFGPELAWVGMVLVHPDHRRRGIGTALLRRCLDHLFGDGIRCIKLDATPEGKEVYRPLGFQEEWSYSRWDHPGWQGSEAAPAMPLRPWERPDLDVVAPFDARAFGVSRIRLLEALAGASQESAVYEAGPGRLSAYGFLRRGSRAWYLGPLVATESTVGLAVAECLLSRRRGERTFWDIPDQNTGVADWALRHGFIRQRALMRMYLGANSNPGNSQQLIGLSGPETG